MFNTTIRTGLGEVLNLPNSMITGSVTRNYSWAVQGPGYIVDTVVTIGYDTPWRQVEAMLTEAARGGAAHRRHPRQPQAAGIPDRAVGFLPGIPPGRPGGAERAEAAGGAAEPAARQYPGCVQRIRRADHVAALSGRPGTGEVGAARTLVQRPSTGIGCARGVRPAAPLQKAPPTQGLAIRPPPRDWHLPPWCAKGSAP